MSDDELPSRFAISPLIDVEIDAAGLGLVGLSADVPHDLRVDVTSAVIASRIGNKSIDYTKKRYMQDVPEHMPRDTVVRRLCAKHLRGYEAFYLGFIPSRDDEPIGVFAFDLAMVRSRESLKLLLLSARQGFLMEPALIARALLEKFAYAAYCWDKTDDAAIFQSKPQSLISTLNDFHPYCGRAYGLLSKLCHYDPMQHYRFIGFEDATVIERSWRFKIISMAFIFIVLRVKRRLFQVLYAGRDQLVGLLEATDGLKTEFEEYFAKVDDPVVRDLAKIFEDPPAAFYG